MTIEELEKEIKTLIVESLMLDDITAEEIESTAPLFGEGLGLDSIDALELSIALEKKYGVNIKASDEQKRRIFGSVRELARYVSESQG